MEGIAYCECPALPPEAMVKCHPMLPLRAMSASVAMQQQGPVSMSMVVLPLKMIGHLWSGLPS